jgi:hypothetical protein
MYVTSSFLPTDLLQGVKRRIMLQPAEYKGNAAYDLSTMWRLDQHKQLIDHIVQVSRLSNERASVVIVSPIQSNSIPRFVVGDLLDYNSLH